MSRPDCTFVLLNHHKDTDDPVIRKIIRSQAATKKASTRARRAASRLLNDTGSSNENLTIPKTSSPPAVGVVASPMSMSSGEGDLSISPLGLQGEHATPAMWYSLEPSIKCCLCRTEVQVESPRWHVTRFRTDGSLGVDLSPVQAQPSMQVIFELSRSYMRHLTLPFAGHYELALLNPSKRSLYDCKLPVRRLLLT